jgi:hypothetical protein
MNGAQIFETAVLVPKWTAAPPDSFRLLADKNGTSLKTFWVIFHSLHEITFILAIVFCWKLDPIRNWLLILFAIHFGVRLWTLTYFAPTIIDFQHAGERGITDNNLINKASLWKTMNYIRVGLFVIVSLGLIPIFLKVMSLRLR